MDYIVNNKVIDFHVVQIMGILNITPDSFFDGGKYYSSSLKAIDHVANMVNAGANFIDIGGESTRPGSREISENEEVSRVVPIVYEICKRFNVFVSVNTSKALVMRESAEAGAHIINDVRSLSEIGAVEAILSYPQLSVCLMHMKGSPVDMQKAPYYDDVIKEIDRYFEKKINWCESCGINRNRLLIDPGFGFGKQLTHNYQLLAHLLDFHHFELPLVIGISRKSMLDLLGNKCPSHRLISSVSSAVIAALQGIQILRVHDVEETAEALRIVRATLRSKGKYFV